MSRKLHFVLLVSLVFFSGCNSKKGVGGFVEENPVLPIPTNETSDPAWASSIASYRPVFGKSETVLQFPFGTANPSNSTIRLTKTITNGKLSRSYQYDALNRLAERTDYYTDGEHIYKKTLYKYDQAGGLSELTQKLNKDARDFSGYPKTNDLLPGEIYGFIPVKDSLAWIQRIYKNENETIVVDRVYLGFSPAGALIWEEHWNQQGRVNYYKVNRRNEVGNITFSRYAHFEHNVGDQYFTYDNHPNPYRTTGDFQTNDIFDFDASNINNLLTQGASNYPEWRYDYQYRPDGYPSLVKVYRSKELERTIEYIYNQ